MSTLQQQEALTLVPIKREDTVRPTGFEGVPAEALAVLQVDLNAIVHNFNYLTHQLQSMKAEPALCGAVVKADAYGLGAVPIAQALAQAGCQHFFVATLSEATALRQVLATGEIYVLNGLLPGTEALFVEHHVTPILNDLGQVTLWQNWAHYVGQTLPAVLHVDTGIWRLGLPVEEIQHLSGNLPGIELRYFMSHLACSEQENHPKNLQQLQRFQKLLLLFPGVKTTFSSSQGMFFGPDYHGDLVRCGKNLFGLGERRRETKALRPVVRAFARILQTRWVEAGETIGYGASYKTQEKMRLVTIGIGYADGLIRSLSNRGKFHIAGHPTPIVGYVSMDLITIDATQVPPHYIYPGGWVEVIGEHTSVEDLAQAAGTTSREITCHLGSRYYRIYKPLVWQGE